MLIQHIDIDGVVVSGLFFVLPVDLYQAPIALAWLHLGLYNPHVQGWQPRVESPRSLRLGFWRSRGRRRFRLRRLGGLRPGSRRNWCGRWRHGRGCWRLWRSRRWHRRISRWQRRRRLCRWERRFRRRQRRRGGCYRRGSWRDGRVGRQWGLGGHRRHSLHESNGSLQVSHLVGCQG